MGGLSSTSPNAATDGRSRTSTTTSVAATIVGGKKENHDEEEEEEDADNPVVVKIKSTSKDNDCTIANIDNINATKTPSTPGQFEDDWSTDSDDDGDDDDVNGYQTCTKETNYNSTEIVFIHAPTKGGPTTQRGIGTTNTRHPHRKEGEI